MSSHANTPFTEGINASPTSAVGRPPGRHENKSKLWAWQFLCLPCKIECLPSQVSEVHHWLQVVVNYASSAGAAEEAADAIKQSGGDAITVKADLSKREEIQS